MYLKNISFRFDVEAMSFSEISCSFELHDMGKSETMLEELKKQFSVLEEIADRCFVGEGIVKKETGTITDQRIESGYKYLDKTLVFPSNISYSADVMGQKLVSPCMYARILNNVEDESKGLKAYDAILALPDLKLDIPAMHTKDKIAMLRNNREKGKQGLVQKLLTEQITS